MLAAAVALFSAAAVPVAQAQCVGCQSVAIVDIDSERDCSYWASFGGQLLVVECRNRFHALREMIETAIVKTNKFSVFERSRLSTLLDERALSAIGLTDGTAHRAKLKGVDFLIYGKITEFGTASSNVTDPRYAVEVNTAAMALDLKIVNVRTGQIVSANSVREELQTSGGLLTRSGGSASGMDAGQVYGQIERRVADAIAAELVFAGYPMRVIKVDGERMFVNYGSGFLSPGQRVRVMSLGEPLIDPTTNQHLGQTETPIGDFEVEEVTPNFSVARRVTPGLMPSRGDIIRIPRPRASGSGSRAIERAELPF
ncbi:hypothetical protein TS85_16075 [Sphingomonas hengshuiensis]|uniref:Curli production assembly/transport component CsgG n=1 Tax=Sphingomonas hengshuiensis TaxID=1609977 RepID=A0A7U4LFX7_9SPHN|nr:hypothetical protein TS85_16075 [Sphingomonas hengshuiensis]